MLPSSCNPPCCSSSTMTSTCPTTTSTTSASPAAPPSVLPQEILSMILSWLSAREVFKAPAMTSLSWEVASYKSIATVSNKLWTRPPCWNQQCALRPSTSSSSSSSSAAVVSVLSGCSLCLSGKGLNDHVVRRIFVRSFAIDGWMRRGGEQMRVGGITMKKEGEGGKVSSDSTHGKGDLKYCIAQQQQQQQQQQQEQQQQCQSSEASAYEENQHDMLLRHQDIDIGILLPGGAKGNGKEAIDMHVHSNEELIGAVVSAQSVNRELLPPSASQRITHQGKGQNKRCDRLRLTSPSIGGGPKPKGAVVVNDMCKLAVLRIEWCERVTAQAIQDMLSVTGDSLVSLSLCGTGNAALHSSTLRAIKLYCHQLQLLDLSDHCGRLVGDKPLKDDSPLTDSELIDLMEKVGSTLKILRVFNCNALTHVGITAIFRNCRQLQELDVGCGMYIDCNKHNSTRWTSAWTPFHPPDRTFSTLTSLSSLSLSSPITTVKDEERSRSGSDGGGGGSGGSTSVGRKVVNGNGSRTGSTDDDDDYSLNFNFNFNSLREIFSIESASALSCGGGGGGGGGHLHFNDGHYHYYQQQQQQQRQNQALSSLFRSSFSPPYLPAASPELSSSSSSSRSSSSLRLPAMTSSLLSTSPTSPSATSSSSGCLLVKLSLRGGRRVSSEALQGLAKGAPMLQWLDLAGVQGVDDACLQVLGSRLDLTNINLSCCTKVTDSGVRALANSSPQLREISLHSVQVTDNGVRWLVKFCPLLSAINLSLSGVTSRVVRTLLGAQRLRWVNLRCCHSLQVNDAVATLRREMLRRDRHSVLLLGERPSALPSAKQTLKATQPQIATMPPAYAGTPAGLPVTVGPTKKIIDEPSLDSGTATRLPPPPPPPPLPPMISGEALPSLSAGTQRSPLPPPPPPLLLPLQVNTTTTTTTTTNRSFPEKTVNQQPMSQERAKRFATATTSITASPAGVVQVLERLDVTDVTSTTTVFFDWGKLPRSLRLVDMAVWPGFRGLSADVLKEIMKVLHPCLLVEFEAYGGGTGAVDPHQQHMTFPYNRNGDVGRKRYGWQVANSRYGSAWVQFQVDENGEVVIPTGISTTRVHSPKTGSGCGSRAGVGD